MPLSDHFPELQGWKSVETNPTALPQLPTPEVQVSPFLRTVLPLPLQYSGDTIKQYNRPGLSSFRSAPLPPGGIPTINSAAISAVTGTVQRAIQTVTGTTDDVEVVLSNVQSGTSYPVKVSDRDTLISMTNNLGGTVSLLGTPTQPGTFVQAVYFGASANSASVTVTNSSGNFMFMQVDTSDGSGTPPTVSDTKGNTWVQIRHDANAGNTSVSIWYAANIAGGSNTITVTNFSSAAFCIPVMVEYSGVALVSPLDQQSVCASTSATTITTGFENELVIFVSSLPSSGSPPTYGSGWTGRIVTAAKQLVEDQLAPTPGTVFSTTGAEATFPAGGQLFYLVSFKLAAAASTTLFPAGWYTFIQNVGTGIFNVVSTSQIDRSNSGVPLGTNQGAMFVFDGFNWFTVRGSSSLSFPVTVAQGGTGANLSATGGTSQVLKQTSVGAAVTVAQLSAADLSNGTTGTGAIVLSSGSTGTGAVVRASAASVTALQFSNIADPTLVNGANNNVGLGGTSFARVVGPTASFNITGFAGGTDGRILYLYNTTVFAMTISNNNISSANANRILTLTGADVVLRTGQSFATFIYDSVQGFWILVGTN